FVQRRVKRLLVVVNDPALQTSIVELIGADDVETTVVSTGAQALAELRSHEFECLVLDLRLPDISGFELIERIQKEMDQTNLPIIVYTGRELTANDEEQLHTSEYPVVIKVANSPESLLAETALFLHRAGDSLPEPK